MFNLANESEVMSILLIELVAVFVKQTSFTVIHVIHCQSFDYLL